MENLDLIDWRMVGYASLWILGLAIVLTALGFADYHASVEKRRRREVLRKPGYQSGINLGLTLFCLGLTGSARTWWERALWWILAIAFGAYTWAAWRAHRKAGVAGPEEKEDPNPGS